MEFRYFDAHTHAHFPVYGDEKDAMIRRAADGGVGMITVGTRKDTSLAAVTLAEQYEHVWAAIGLYPGHTVASFHDEDELGVAGQNETEGPESFDYDFFKKLAESEKVVAVGECGLDYPYCRNEEEKEIQKVEFIKQIEFADEIKRPLMIHCRDAYGDVADIFKARGTARSHVMHSFRGTIEEARRFVEMGFYFTFGGVITFRPKKDGVNYTDVIRSIPTDRLLSETDAPWVAPVPHRGKRNEPAYVVEVVKKFAEIKDLPPEIIREQILENTRRAFSIDI